MFKRKVLLSVLLLWKNGLRACAALGLPAAFHFSSISLFILGQFYAKHTQNVYNVETYIGA